MGWTLLHYNCLIFTAVLVRTGAANYRLSDMCRAYPVGNPGFVILQTINGDIHVLMAGNECTHTKDILYKDIHTLYICMRRCPRNPLEFSALVLVLAFVVQSSEDILEPLAPKTQCWVVFLL